MYNGVVKMVQIIQINSILKNYISADDRSGSVQIIQINSILKNIGGKYAFIQRFK